MTQPRLLGGRYEVAELIGYGGMAEVHRGRDTRLNRVVAIKVLRPDLARDPAFLTRFRREAHSAAGLNHPSIVSVYDTGEEYAPDGTPLPFIVMEYVEGRTLRDILRIEGPLPARRAMQITADVCAALDFSHRNGIVHRDIKPANVMITPTGAVKVMDFGIARAVADTSATVTQTANVIGTAQYLSPEQARGEAVDARSDVYSTGCLLYELITGVPPFQGDSPVAVAYQHVRENPVLPSARNPDVPRPLDSIVMKSLAKNQLNRYQSAGEMRADLQRALADQPVLAETVMTDAERTQFIARPPVPVPSTPLAPMRQAAYEPVEERRRSGLVWALLVAALLLVIAAGAYAIVFLGKDNTATKTTAVPQIIGQLPAAAEAQLRKANLKPSRGNDVNGTCDDGQKGAKGAVCTLDRKVGESVDEGTVITYHLYTPKTTQVPYVQGGSLQDAVTKLHGANLTYTVKNVNDRSAAGTVLHQDPSAFKIVTPGTSIVLKVSTGKIKLADVTGQTFDDARAKLSGDFDNVRRGDRVATSDASKADTVVAERPAPGKAYDPGQQVTLDVYRYVPPTPTRTTPSASHTSASASSSASSSASPSTGSSSASPTGSASTHSASTSTSAG